MPPPPMDPTPETTAMRPFELRPEFRDLPYDPSHARGPYAVDEVKGWKIPFADKGQHWRAPYAFQLRSLALSLWQGCEYDAVLLRVFGDPKKNEPHTEVLHLRDRWTDRLLERFFGAEWDEAGQRHRLAAKTNLPRLIQGLLSYYRVVAVDYVKEEDSRIFLPRPERTLGQVMVIRPNPRQSESFRFNDYPGLLMRYAVEEEVAAAPEPRLRLTPKLPTLPPFLRQAP